MYWHKQKRNGKCHLHTLRWLVIKHISSNRKKRSLDQEFQVLALAALRVTIVYTSAYCENLSLYKSRCSSTVSKTQHLRKALSTLLSILRYPKLACEGEPCAA
jgi:hypothetical protein